MKNSLFFLMLMFANIAYAQIPDFTLKSNNQQLIEDALKKSMFVIEQSYQLQDTVNKQYFGRNGKDEFNRIFSIGVKVRNGYCVSEIVAKPWEYDNEYEQYRSFYRPSLYKTYYRELNDSVTIERRNFNNVKKQEFYNGIFLSVTDTIAFNKLGLSIDDSPGSKDGWVVCLTSDSILQSIDSATIFSYVIYKHKLDVKNDIKEYPISSPSSNKNILTGIYVVPTLDGIGTVEFTITGMLYSADGRWYIIPIPSNNFATKVTDQHANKLTPIEKAVVNVNTETDKKEKRK